MQSFVVDTSVIIKWFNQEDEQQVDIAKKIYGDVIDHRIALIVPSLLAIELINVLSRGKKMPEMKIKKAVNDLFSLPLIIKEPTQSVLEQTTDIMVHFALAAYDALFVATALEEKCKLISDDTKGHGQITDGSVIMLEQYQSPYFS